MKAAVFYEGSQSIIRIRPQTRPGSLARRRSSEGAAGGRRQPLPRRAASIFPTLIFRRVIIGLEHPFGSGPVRVSRPLLSCRGAICQEKPQRSLHQPHALPTAVGDNRIPVAVGLRLALRLEATPPRRSWLRSAGVPLTGLRKGRRASKCHNTTIRRVAVAD